MDRIIAVIIIINSFAAAAAVVDKSRLRGSVRLSTSARGVVQAMMCFVDVTFMLSFITFYDYYSAPSSKKIFSIERVNL